MNKLVINKKENITSLELLELINKFREEEGRTTKLRHDTLLDIIRDEFEEELLEHSKVEGLEGVQKILETSYTHPQNKQNYPMFVLGLDQARQVLIRESKYVRKKIFEYIKKLEQEIINLKIALANRNNTEWLMTRQQGKLIRRNETDVISSLIVYARNQGSKNYNKLYTVYSKLVNNLVGINSNMRDIVDMKTLEHIRLLEDLFSKLIVNSMEQEIYYKEIYQICKRKGTELMNLLEIECKQLDNKEVDLIEYTEK